MAASVVQSGFDDLATSATATVTLTSVVAGNSIVAVSMFYDTPTAPTASVSDGTAFTQAARAASAPASTECTACAIHYRHNVAAGTHAVVGTTDASALDRYGWFYVFEVSGLANSAPNQTKTAIGESTAPATGNSTATTAANCFVVAAMSIGTGTADAGIDVPATTGYTNRFVRQDVNAEQAGSVDTKSVSSTGVQSAAWGTLSASHGWASALAAFEESASGYSARNAAAYLQMMGSN